MENENTQLKKQKDFAFGKDVYLLGKDEEGVNYWLEAPSWDCNWYWGFGYIETYQNNFKPSKARDISSHSHANNFMSEYFTEWNGSKPILKEKTFSEEEGWELSELFKQFYLFKNIADIYHSGTAGVATSKITWKDENKYNEINKIVIPKITARIIEILSPNN